MKNPNFGRASFLVFWTSESQVRSGNAESYSSCSLVVPPRNKIAVAPSGFEMEEWGHQLQNGRKCPLFDPISTFSPVSPRGEHCKRSKATFPHQFVALFSMVKSKTRSKIHQVPAVLKKRGFLMDRLLSAPSFVKKESVATASSALVDYVFNRGIVTQTNGVQRHAF